MTSLEDRFNTSRYLAPTSDIVALMTLEHQTRMNNLMTRIGWDARIALREGKGTLEPGGARADQHRDRGNGRLHAFRGRGAAEGAGHRASRRLPKRLPSAGLGIRRADHCGILTSEAPVSLPVVLFDLQRGVRRDAGGGARTGLPAAV